MCKPETLTVIVAMSGVRTALPGPWERLGTLDGVSSSHENKES